MGEVPMWLSIFWQLFNSHTVDREIKLDITQREKIKMNQRLWLLELTVKYLNKPSVTHCRTEMTDTIIIYGITVTAALRGKGGTKSLVLIAQNSEKGVDMGGR